MTLLTIIFINLGISLISFVGVVTFVHKKLQSDQIMRVMVSFAAGVLLSSAFFNILGEALHEGKVDDVMLSTLLGIVLGFLMERSLLWYHHHHEDTHNIKTSAWLVIFGDAIHNFMDGFVVAATAVVSPGLAITTAFAIAAHEIPQELANFMILVHSGLNRKKAVLYNFFSALTAIVGGIAGYYFIEAFTGALAPALGIAAGIFIYIATADLIPELHEDYKKNQSIYQVLPFFFGITLMYILSKFLTH